MNIIMMAHGHLATSMLESASMILGPLDTHVSAIDFDKDDSFDHLSQQLETHVSHEGTLVFCDLKGGTPFNAAFLLAKKYPIKIICGMNLGMMLEYLIRYTNDEQTPPLDIAKEAGIKAIEIFDFK